MAVVATGFFDGVHLGHRKVVETLVSRARERGEESLVLTFWPHPRTVFQNGARELRLLTTLEEKTAMLKSLGVERVEVIPFDRTFASKTAEGYLDMLGSDYGATEVILGYDNRLGCDQLCADAVGPVAETLGLDWQVVPAVGGISSTLVRKALSEGRVEDASSMLGYSYMLHGVTVSGKQLGRTIGFPTANMQMYEPLKLIPRRGAYLTRVEVLGKEYFGMTNVGDIVETHILDFHEDIYGLDIRVRFLSVLREEMKFGSVDELRIQLEEDKRKLFLSLRNLWKMSSE